MSCLLEDHGILLRSMLTVSFFKIQMQGIVMFKSSNNNNT